VPTGEIDLVEATGYLLAGAADAKDGRGINRMMEFVNQSRLGVAAMGAGIMRRVFLEAAIRAHQRRAFGKRLIEFGMVRETLLDLLVESEAASSMLFRVTSRLTGNEAIGEGDRLPRILVPLTKQRCTRGGIESASAALEVFGGNGYIEDWPMARQLRDAQCHTIWEGTENILSLDVLRTMHKDDSLPALLQLVRECSDGASHPLLASLRQSLGAYQARIADRLSALAGGPPELALLHARKLSHELCDLTQSALLLDDAQFELSQQGSARKALVAAWFIRRHIEPGGNWHAGNEGIALSLAEPLLSYEVIDEARARELGKL
jgi:hypothetical protein